MTAVLLLVAAGDSANAQTPRACQAIRSDAAPESRLRTQDNGVISREIFILSRTTQHWVTTYSDTAPSGGARSEQCFRYEVENTGSQDIRQLYWPLAGVSLDTLSPGPRISKVVFRPVVEAPIDIVSVLYAFENERIETRAWAERHYKDLSSSPDMQRIVQVKDGARENSVSDASAQSTGDSDHFAKISIRKADDVLSGLGDFLQTRGLPTSSFMIFKFSEQVTKLPTLRDHFSGPGLELDVTSTAHREGAQIIIETRVNGTGGSEKSLFAFPALQAWEKIRKPLTDVKQYGEFVSQFQKAKSHGARQISDVVFRLTVPAGPKVKLSRMDHPILVTTGERKQCILVASYSPSPINFSLNDCRSWLRERPASAITPITPITPLAPITRKPRQNVDLPTSGMPPTATRY